MKRNNGRYNRDSQERQEKTRPSRSNKEMRLNFKQLPEMERRSQNAASEAYNKDRRRIADALERIADFTDLMTEIMLLEYQDTEEADYDEEPIEEGASEEEEE